MTPPQENIINLLIGVVMLSVVTTATYLVAVVGTSLSGGNYVLGALAALAFFLVGWVLVGSWIVRHVTWWDR